MLIISNYIILIIWIGLQTKPKVTLAENFEINLDNTVANNLYLIVALTDIKGTLMQIWKSRYLFVFI